VVLDDELMGIPPGELFDEGGVLELNGMPNAGAETMPDGGAATTLEDDDKGDDDDGDDALESADPEAGWPDWLSLAASPLSPLKPIDPCERVGEPVDWPDSVSVDASPP
jgi:hypothetical protein